MASQKDFFLDDKEDDQSNISSTYPKVKNKYDYTYDQIILFDWKVDVVKPFKSHKLSLFNDKDIKKHWISKKLGVESRILKLTNLSPFPGGVFSLFGKLEQGMAERVRKNIVNDLNDQYFAQAAKEPDADVLSCLKKVAESTSYRYLSDLPMPLGKPGSRPSTSKSSYSSDGANASSSPSIVPASPIQCTSKSLKRSLAIEERSPSNTPNKRALESPVRGEKSKVG